jgi:hypothetical protein
MTTSVRDATFHALRRRLALAGGHPSRTGSPDAIGRQDAPGYAPARLLEPPMRAVAVGAATPLDGPLAFLDGVQHTAVLGHLGTAPLVAARIAAGVRRRVERRTTGVVVRQEVVVVGRPEALSRCDLGPEIRAIALDTEDPPHPLGDVDRARAQVDRARVQLEIAAASAYRSQHRDDWLVVDGTLTVSPEWSADPRMVGVIKSHASLPFAGMELETYLTLPAGHRSAVFAPGTRQVTPVHSWALRLRDWGAHDLLHGLVRVETAARATIPGDADAISRWLLTEVAPIANDPRADRLLYGVHDVERWLRARSA